MVPVISREEEMAFPDQCFLHICSLCAVHRLGNCMKHQNGRRNFRNVKPLFYSSRKQQQFHDDRRYLKISLCPGLFSS